MEQSVIKNLSFLLMNISLFLRDLGYGATFSSNVIFATLELISIYPNKASSVTDEQVGKLLAMMVSTAQGLPSNPSIISITQGLLSDVELDQLQKLKTWNVELFFPLLMKMNPVLDWTNVLHYLDQPDLVFLDQTSLAIILKATKAVIKDMSLFPTLIFLNPWNNQKAQLSFLFHALTLTHEIFTMNQLLTNKVIQTDLPSRSSVASSVINSAASSPWNYLDLVQFLVSISDGPNKVKVREIFNLGVQQSPDLLLLALCQEAVY
jgi:CCR4-NOT transcription complex subunit 1